MATIILVRHAMPHQDPHTPPKCWSLDSVGLQAAADLARQLPTTDYRVVSSTEPKAFQTAEAIGAVRGGAVTVDERLVEVGRPQTWVPNHPQLAAAYAAGAVHEGWEEHESVIERFDAAVDAHLAAAQGRRLVVATHGMALTCWVAARIGLDDPVGFWRGLSFPDLVKVRLPGW